MFPTPQPSPFLIPDFSGLGVFPLTAEISPAVLTVLVALVGIFVAALTVMLMYHWRRFPFEHDLFRRVERLYFFGVVLLLGAAVIGIFLSA